MCVCLYGEWKNEENMLFFYPQNLEKYLKGFHSVIFLKVCLVFEWGQKKFS